MFILLVIDRSIDDDVFYDDDDQLSFRFQFNFSHTSNYLGLLFYIDLINIDSLGVKLHKKIYQKMYM